MSEYTGPEGSRGGPSSQTGWPVDAAGGGPSWKLTAVLRDEVYRDVELVPMICGEITDKKLTSNLIRELSSLHPLQAFLHLKRVKTGKNGTLMVLVSPLTSGELHKDQINAEQRLLQHHQIASLKALSVVHVPRFKPVTRKQYEEAINHWPTHFHEDKRLEMALRGEMFNDREVALIGEHMQVAMEEAELSPEVPGQLSVGAVMVDPITNQIIARAHSDTDSHPLKHAVMACIDKVACSQGGGAWSMSRATLQQEAASKDSDSSHGGTADDSEYYATSPQAKRPKKDRQYLCSGYNLFTTQEPCVMCAMALVHSRVGRVFFGRAEPQTGGLGSQYKIHAHHGINHHFEVYTRTT